MKLSLLNQLRDRSIPSTKFRAVTASLSRLMASEISTQTQSKHIILVPILRAGIALLAAFLEVFQDAPIGFFGVRRDEKTALPHLYYENLPPLPPNCHVLLLDPMLATGGSANLTLDILQAKGARHITLVSVIAALPGVAIVQRRHPDVRIYSVAIDDQLDAQKMIIPGLGDFGDRYCGTS